MKRKTLILGFDGTEMSLIEKYAAAGELPFFARIIKDGSWGLLRSTPNFGSASAWPSFYTGLNPGRHGMFDFLYREENSYNLLWTTKRLYSGIPFWKAAGEQGLKSAVINMPVTYPAEPFPGIQVAGWMTPKTSSPGFTHPKGLSAEIEKSLGRHIFAPSVKAEINKGNYHGAWKSLREAFEYKLALSEYLMDKYPVDIFCSAWISTDQAGHYLWHLIDEKHPQYDPLLTEKFAWIVLETYKNIDRAAKKLYHKFGGSLIIMSDHGHGRNPLGEPHLKSLLIQCGLLRMKGNSDGSGSGFSKIISRIFDMMQGLLGKPLKRFLIANFSGLLNFALTHQNLADVDWENTKVYLVGEPTVNLQGREPKGIVPQSEYESTLRQIEGLLYSIRDTRSGEKAVQKIYRRDEVYRGEFVKYAPDLLIVWNPDIVVERLEVEFNGHNITTEAHYSDYRSGNHKPMGILFMMGEGIKPGYRNDEAEIIDLHPTILYLSGCSIANNLDGKLLNDFIEPQYLQRLPAKYHSGESTGEHLPDYATLEEKKAAHKRLKDLGYL